MKIWNNNKSSLQVPMKLSRIMLVVLEKRMICTYVRNEDFSVHK